MSQKIIQDPNADYASPIPQMPKPAYLSPVTMSTFGTRLIRITGDPGTNFTYTKLPSTPDQIGTWGSRARHYYSTVQAWNADMTRIYVENRQSGTNVAGSPTKLLIDGTDYKTIWGFGTNTQAALYELRWHPTDPNVIINVDSTGLKLQWWDVPSDTKTKEWTLPYAAQTGIGSGDGQITPDGRYVLLLSDLKMAVVDMSTHPTLTIGPDYTFPSNSGQNHGGIVRSGKYVMVSFNNSVGNPTGNGEQKQIFDVNPSTLELTPRDLSAQGQQWCVSIAISCTTDGTTTLTSSSAYGGTPSIEPGMTITGPNIPAGTKVVSTESISSLTMSAAATGSGTNSTTFADDASQGFIRRLGHEDVFSDPSDGDRDYGVGQNQGGGTDTVINGKRISHVNKISFETGVLTPLTQISGNPPPKEISSSHISTRSVLKPEWVCVTWYEPTSDKRFGGEANFVHCSGNRSMARAGHVRTDQSVYQAEAHALGSPDGKRILFASNWALNCDGLCGNPGDNGDQQDYVISGMFDPDSIEPIVSAGTTVVSSKTTTAAY